MPRNYPLSLKKAGNFPTHFAMVGMATVVNGEPLFYDGFNEHGLAMAGLNFPENAYYPPLQEGKINVAPYELIPYLLGTCQSVDEAAEKFKQINLVNLAYSDDLPLAPLHFIICDKKECITVEPTKEGLRVYPNRVGILTNNPPFEYHLARLNDFRNLRAGNGDNAFGIPLNEYCLGLGAVGLPGDMSSPSRFVRVAFHKANSVCEGGERATVSQCFHLLSSVEMPRGSCKTDEGKNDITVYSACMNTAQARYYYTTYENRQISCVDMRKCDLNATAISRFPICREEQIYFEKF